jgi:hypothetical protein
MRPGWGRQIPLGIPIRPLGGRPMGVVPTAT